MTDPLSITASVGGLALLARDIAKGINEIKHTLKAAEGELHGLYKSVISLYSVLEGAKLVLEQMDELSFADTSPGDIVFACNDTFEAIRELLSKYKLDLQDGIARASSKEKYYPPEKVGGRWDKLKQATRWYFDKEEVAKLCADLEQHKSTLSIAMSKDSMSALAQVLRTQTRTSHHLEEIRRSQAEIRAAQIQESKRRLSDKQNRIMKELSESEPQEALERHLALRQKGTGMWFLEGSDFQDFISENNSSLWLYGIPGAGKSVLSSTIIEYINDLRTSRVATAFFFCEHNNPNAQSARNILGSIARQLAIQNSGAFAELEKFHEKHTSFGKFTADGRALLGLIWDMSNHLDTTLVVIDGLDECFHDRSQMVQILSELSDSDNGTVKSLLTSRDERDIRNGLEEFSKVEIKASKADVRLFVAAELESRFSSATPKDTALKDEILQYLVDNSDGMFQWVKCQLDYLSSLPSHGKKRKALRELPPDLPRTYERILLRATETAKGFTATYLERTLRWIALAARPLSVPEISHAIGIEDGDTSFDDPVDMEKIICHCSSLIKQDNGILTFSHFSVKEYLRTILPGAGLLTRFQLDDKEGHKYLAGSCLTYLLLEEFNKPYNDNKDLMDNAAEDYHLYSYASRFWTYHAQPSSEMPDSVSLLARRLFETHKSNNFVLWAYNWISQYVALDDDIQLSSRMADISPLHLASMCGLHEIVDLLLHKGVDVSQCSTVLSTPLECVAGLSLLNSQDDGLPNSEQRRKTAKRILQENVAQHTYAPYAVQGAIILDDADLLSILLEAGCPLTATAIRLANDNGSDEIIRAVLEATKIERLDPDSTLLEFQRLLVHRAADYTSGGGVNGTKPKIPDRIPAHLEDDYQEITKTAAINGQLATIKQILSKLSGLVGLERKTFLSELLCDTSEYGHTDVVEYLLSEGADISHKGQKHGRTPLHRAALGRCTKLVQLLLTLSPDPQENIEMEDDWGQAPWFGAVRSGFIEILELFLEAHPSLDLEKTSKTGYTAIHSAIMSKYRPMFWFLYKRGLNITCSAHDGVTPLHILLHSGLGELELPREYTRLVIDTFFKEETDLTKKAWNDMNYVHILFENVDIENAYQIWRAIADDPRFNPCRAAVLEAVNQRQNTPLHVLLLNCAIWLTSPETASRSADIAIKIIQSVCKTKDEVQASLAVRNADGCTPLICFAKALHSRTIPLGLSGLLSGSLPEIFRILIEADSHEDCLNRQDNQRRTVLHWIADCDSAFPFKNVVELLLKHPFDMAIKDRNGYIPLHAAALSPRDNVEFLRRFMERTSTAVLETPFDNDEAILHWLCSTKKDGIEDLVSQYANQIATSVTRDKEGCTALMRAPYVVSTPALVNELLEAAGENVHSRDHNGYDLLFHACRLGGKTFLETLIRNGAKVDEPRGLEGRKVPLILTAAYFKQKECLQILLESGADPYIQDYAGRRLHHYAVDQGNDYLQEIVDPLTGYDYNESILSWSIPLDPVDSEPRYYILHRPSTIHIAAANTKPQALRWLLRSDQRPHDLDQEMDAGETAIFVAAYLGIRQNCEILVLAGATVAKTRQDGCTAFHIACQNGQLDVCEYLLSADNSLPMRASALGTPLEIAVRHGRYEIVRLLLNNDIMIEIPPAVQMDALKTGRRDIAGLIRSRLRIQQRRETGLQTWTQKEVNTLRLPLACSRAAENELLEILETGVDPNRRVNEAFDSALHIACEKGWKKSLVRLVEEGAELEARNHYEATPLLVASRFSKWQCLQILHKFGARLDVVDNGGWTVIHGAARAGYSDMVTFFIENGCNPNALTYGGYTPLMHTEQPRCAAALLRGGADPFITTQHNGSAISEMSFKENCEEVLRMVLAEGPVERMFSTIDLLDMEYKTTPLYIAAFRGRSGNVKALLDHGADINLPGGLFGTPYHAAFVQGHVETVRILAANGAKPCMVIRDGCEHAAWFWEHGGQFSFPAPNGAWVPASLPLQSKKKPRMIRANEARKGRFWEHGYRFCLPAALSGAWLVA